ncbi:MAG: anti-sigma factor [Caulobacterales bacterium]|nr:anti-sigma factor [Caulobacterales bacterium]
MTACPDREPMLQALLDGELDAANAVAVEAHLKTCAGCASHFQTLRVLRERLAEADLAEPAPAHLRVNIDNLLAAEDRRAEPASLPRRPWWANLAAAWGSAGAMTAVAAALLVAQVAPVADPLEGQLVASHVRSLQQPGHLIDIATSDRHVVRPWFNGKVDFAPPTPDLAAEGFPLVGGRLDYAAGRTVAAVVYRRRAHVINLFVMPAQPHGLRLGLAGPKPPPGYSVVHWTHAGLDFWAVSDVEGGDLQAFHKAFEAAAT